MRYVVRNNFFGLELKSEASDQQVPKDKHAERQRAIPSQSSDNPRLSERKDAVAGDQDCLSESQCAEPSREPARPQCGSEEPDDKDGHIMHSLNMYDDEIWEDPGAAV